MGARVCGGCERRLPLESVASSSPITVTRYSQSAFAVWSVRDILRLRRTHRLVGHFIGSFPPQTHQNEFLTRPLLLSLEEVALGVHHGFIVVTAQRQNPCPTKRMREEFQRAREKDLALQQEQWQARRALKRLEYANEEGGVRASKEGKESQGCSGWVGSVVLRTDAGEDHGYPSVMGRLSEPSPGHITTSGSLPLSHRGWWTVWGDGGSQATSTPWSGLFTPPPSHQLSWLSVRHPAQTPKPTSTATDTTPPPISPPDTPCPDLSSEAVRVETVRFAVFADLWYNAHFITSGIKFGCDFLAYPGDPEQFHAHHCVAAQGRSQAVSPFALACRGRLAGAVKKAAVIGSVGSQSGVRDVPQSHWIRRPEHANAVCIMCALSLDVQYLTVDWAWT